MLLLYVHKVIVTDYTKCVQTSLTYSTYADAELGLLRLPEPLDGRGQVGFDLTAELTSSAPRWQAHGF